MGMLNIAEEQKHQRRNLSLSIHVTTHVVNVYACNATISEIHWSTLAELEESLSGTTLLCGDFNARGSEWGNTITNPQGTALENALDNSMTRFANQEGHTGVQDGGIGHFENLAYLYCIVIASFVFTYNIIITPISNSSISRLHSLIFSNNMCDKKYMLLKNILVPNVKNSYLFSKKYIMILLSPSLKSTK